MLLRAKEAYAIWHKNLININRLDRYTIGARIDEAFLSFLETLFTAGFAHDKFEKLSLVSQSIGKCDIVKFLLQIGWEQKVISHSTYGTLALLLDEIGRMLGGWKKNLKEKTPARN